MQKAPVTGHQGSPSGRTETWTSCEMHVPRSSLAESTRNLMVQSRALKQSLEKLERHVDIQKRAVILSHPPRFYGPMSGYYPGDR